MAVLSQRVRAAAAQGETSHEPDAARRLARQHRRARQRRAEPGGRLLEANRIDPATITLVRERADAGRGRLLDGASTRWCSPRRPSRCWCRCCCRRRASRLFDFAQAEAYARRFPFLSPVTLPRGVVDLARDIPPADVRLVAPTATLVARKRTHPALIQLFVQAAQQVHGGAGWFQKKGDFPNARNTERPLASEAQRFYASGPPVLQRYLPFWLANLVDRMWPVLVTIVAALMPLSRIAAAALHVSRPLAHLSLVLAAARRSRRRSASARRRAAARPRRRSSARRARRRAAQLRRRALRAAHPHPAWSPSGCAARSRRPMRQTRAMRAMRRRPCTLPPRRPRARPSRQAVGGRPACPARPASPAPGDAPTWCTTTRTGAMLGTRHARTLSLRAAAALRPPRRPTTTAACGGHRGQRRLARQVQIRPRARRLELHRLLPAHARHPHDFGFVPSTCARGRRPARRAGARRRASAGRLRGAGPPARRDRSRAERAGRRAAGAQRPPAGGGGGVARLRRLPAPGRPAAGTARRHRGLLHRLGAAARRRVPRARPRRRAARARLLAAARRAAR